MNELEFGQRIRQQLNSGLQDIHPATAHRLRTARERALACQKVAVHQSALVAVGTFIQHRFDNLRLTQVLAAFALLLGVALSTAWVADQRVAELGDIDSALLSNDLPVAAFTDRGFDAWLKRTSPE